MSGRARFGRVGTAAGMVGAFLLGASTYGAVQLASASTTSTTTYFACLSAKGALSKVGTTAPVCPTTAKVISWNAQGPQGIQGVQGVQGIQGLQGIQGIPGPAGTTAFGTGTQSAVAGTGATCTIGQVILSGGLVADGLPADGQLLSITTYYALFTLFGTLYGGNGTTNFALPDLRSAAPNGLTYSVCATGTYPARS